ncbi:hypothetical protein ES703_69795 [subsurface metagenome]
MPANPVTGFAKSEFHLTNLRTGHVRAVLWLDPSVASMFNSNPVLVARHLQWLEQLQLDMLDKHPT